jgi:hypothetical protein
MNIPTLPSVRDALPPLLSSANSPSKIDLTEDIMYTLSDIAREAGNLESKVNTMNSNPTDLPDRDQVLSHVKSSLDALRATFSAVLSELSHTLEDAPFSGQIPKTPTSALFSPGFPDSGGFSEEFSSMLAQLEERSREALIKTHTKLDDLSKSVSQVLRSSRLVKLIQVII